MSIKKVVIVGPESTGKSTLSQRLAEELGTDYVPEYAREYLENINRDYNEKDLLEIAKGQLRLEDEKAEHAKEMLLCDTDLYVIKVWSEAKYRKCHPWILEQIAARKYDLYLLTYIDTPWEDDPLREHPDEKDRQYFYNIYRNIVVNSGVPWVDIRGNIEKRVSDSLKAIRQHL